LDALRQILSPQDGRILINIPKEYKQKRFEVIVLPIEDVNEADTIQNKLSDFLKSLPKEEPSISEEEILKEVKKVRQERYNA
jgi:hypothetical protein